MCTRAGECDGLIAALVVAALGVLAVVVIVATLWALTIAALLRRRRWRRLARSVVASAVVVGSLVVLGGLAFRWPNVGGPALVAVVLGAVPAWWSQRRRVASVLGAPDTV